MEYEKYSVSNKMQKNFNNQFFDFCKNHNTEGFVLKKLMGDSVVLNVVEWVIVTVGGPEDLEFCGEHRRYHRLIVKSPWT